MRQPGLWRHPGGMANLLRTMTQFVKPPGEVSTRHTENFMGYLDLLKKQSTSSYRPVRRCHQVIFKDNYSRSRVWWCTFLIAAPRGVERPRITEASEGGLYWKQKPAPQRNSNLKHLHLHSDHLEGSCLPEMYLVPIVPGTLEANAGESQIQGQSGNQGWGERPRP